VIRKRSAPGWVLIALLLLGLALRVLAEISWWPVSPTLEDGYQRFTANPFSDLQHSAGYDLIVAVLGHITHQVAVTVIVQHLTGFLVAWLYYNGLRRLTGSGWPGLFPAAIVLLDPDQIFLEHAIMSEAWVVLALGVALYGTVRALAAPRPLWRWPAVAGAGIAAAIMIRSAAAPMLAVMVLTALAHRGWGEHGPQLRAALAMAGTAIVLLLGFAGASAAFGNRFAISPSPGWYLYGRVAQFADCRDFTAPAGTRSLCQRMSPSRRPSAFIYMWTPQSPAVRLFGGFGHQDRLIGGWSRRALEAQPLAFLSTGWDYLRAYWLPGTLPARLSGSTGLDPQLDFTSNNAFAAAAIHHDLERFYAPFTVHPRHWGLQVLRDSSRVVRFGATLLSISTVLVLAGLGLPDRRLRLSVFLFGVGGLSLILIPALLSTYAGRYTVPMAAPMMAAAGVTLFGWLGVVAARRRPGGPRRARPPGPA
jgi:hypothetical protein